jgi:hypothetical protein
MSIETATYVDGKLPSVWNDDGLDNHILGSMWKLLNNELCSKGEWQMIMMTMML